MVLKWVKGNARSRMSNKALLGGKDSDGASIYVGRAFHQGVWLPAKFIPSKNACYVPYNGKEVFVQDFEVLEAKENKFSWEPASDGRIATGAVSTGRDGNDEIYIGRAPYQGSMTVGKIHPSHRCIYLPYGGNEVRLTHYEVLVYKRPSLQWMSTNSHSPLPRNAVLGGRDTDGAEIFVGRASHAGDVMPCKVIPSKRVAYVSYNGSEVSMHNFEVLVGSNAKWKKARDGKVPKGAFPGGSSSGEVLYIGRANHNRSTTVGKLHPSHGCVYIPYGGKEHSFREYEVLTGY
ncbi:CLUMA_CG002994, isoform A [Clunio marinus]|uniref:CLUMA_CG002994, isoform A n=1 Tax=Clunio marinus TaxID=568069 RepID=A0A1J1HMR7_9DIPT|nr:CLUMA_CG002994, isoform A [Clunio marinus]